jgi:hypothetical protein
MSVDTTTLAQLAPGFTGRLLQPTDAEYEDARRVHNGLVDKRPGSLRAAVVSPTYAMPSSWRERSTWMSRSVAAGTTSQVMPPSRAD